MSQARGYIQSQTLKPWTSAGKVFTPSM